MPAFKGERLLERSALFLGFSESENEFLVPEFCFGQGFREVFVGLDHALIFSILRFTLLVYCFEQAFVHLFIFVHLTLGEFELLFEEEFFSLPSGFFFYFLDFEGLDLLFVVGLEFLSDFILLLFNIPLDLLLIYTKTLILSYRNLLFHLIN